MPGLAGVGETLAPAARLQAGVEANVRWSMRQIFDTPEAQARAQEGHYRLVGAMYEIDTGRVRFL